MTLAPLLALLLLPADPVRAVAYVRADPDGLGTGVVIDADKRWLLTCRHVVGERKTAEVFFPDPRFSEREEYLARRDELRALGRLVTGKVLRTSDDLDLALLELDALPPGTPAVPLSDSPPSVGEAVYAVGNRGDLDTLFNVSPGAVRQVGKLADGYAWQGRLLAKDAPAVLLQLPVEEGDSGGPVLNARGELVAVVSGLRRRASLATLGIRADAVRAFLGGNPTPRPPPRSGEAESILRATFWVRPTATDVRTAGVVIDIKRRLVLTSAGGIGPMDRVGVAFPTVEAGTVKGERDSYRDPLAVHLAGGWHVGTVLHRDPARDLALIQLDAFPKGTAAVPFAEIDPDIGEAIAAVSHPAGTEFAFAVSTGSVKQRAKLAFTRTGPKVPASVLQLPAQSNSPGGPMFNGRGELIGVLAAKDAPPLVGYAVRVNEVKAFVGEAELAVAGKLFRDVWAEIGSVNRFAGWAVLAKGDADGALSLHPACVPALLAAGRFDRVLALRPQHSVALLGRATRLLAANEPKAALADLTRLLDLTPADAPARRSLALASAAAGDEARAATEFANVLRLDAEQFDRVKRDIFAHADALERKGESRAADWLLLALSSANDVAGDADLAAGLRRAGAAKDSKGKLLELRRAAGGK